MDQSPRQQRLFCGFRLVRLHPRLAPLAFPPVRRSIITRSRLFLLCFRKWRHSARFAGWNLLMAQASLVWDFSSLSSERAAFVAAPQVTWTVTSGPREAISCLSLRKIYQRTVFMKADAA